MSPLIFAHVRATTEGNLSDQNCHPFKHNRLMFMQNGNIGAFQNVKRDLGASLAERWYLGVEGSTDSEWAFALFLDKLEKLGYDPSSDPGPSGFGSMVLRKALLATIEGINSLTAAYAKRTKCTEATSLLNFAITDGQSVVCTRYVNSKVDEPPTLFYSSGNRWKEPLSMQQKGEYRMDRREKNSDVVLVASEPLTFERDNWVKVPVNSLLIIDDQAVSIMPILDEFYDPNPSQTRSSKLAREMGQVITETPANLLTPGEATPNSEITRPGPVAARLTMKLQDLRTGHSPLRNG